MNILGEIVSQRRRDIHQNRAELPEEQLREEALQTPRPKDFAHALTSPNESPAVIAEIKRASPSRGVIRSELDAAALATELEAHGAAALSILTEPHYFDGAPEFLERAAENVSIPLLCKDFIVEPYQIYQARRWGASAVLLIAAILSAEDIASLCSTASSCGLSVLLEVHTEEELEKTQSAEAPVLGINSRNLENFQTSLQHTLTLLKHVPEECIKVAESGIFSHRDIAELSHAGADAFLIGEALMQSHEPGKELQRLRGKA